MIIFIIKRAQYFWKHWKLGVHLIFRTRRFGVNNKWWGPFDSLFGAKTWKQRLNLHQNWVMMRFRAGSCYFVNDEEFELAFGETREEWLRRTVKKAMKIQKARDSKATAH